MWIPWSLELYGFIWYSRSFKISWIIGFLGILSFGYVTSLKHTRTHLVVGTTLFIMPMRWIFILSCSKMRVIYFLCSAKVELCTGHLVYTGPHMSGVGPTSRFVLQVPPGSSLCNYYPLRSYLLQDIFISLQGAIHGKGHLFPMRHLVK